MIIEAALYSYLSTYAGLTDLISTRLYPLVLPQNPTYPAITYLKVSRVGGRAMKSTNPRHIRARFQFSCWATSYSSAKAVAVQVQTALQDYNGVMGGSGGVTVLDSEPINELDIYEPDTKLYHVPIDIMIWHR